jgi:hypothetical protein
MFNNEMHEITNPMMKDPNMKRWPSMETLLRGRDEFHRYSLPEIQASAPLNLPN